MRARVPLLVLSLIFLTAYAPECGQVSVGKDTDGRWQASLENEKVTVRYGFKIYEETPEGMITDFHLKAYPEENVVRGLLDAAAHRGMIRDASVIADRPEVKIVRIRWNPTGEQQDDFPGPAVSEISIYPGLPYIKIDYLQYCFPHVCDIGSPGGMDCPTTETDCGTQYVMYGADERAEVRKLITADSLRSHPNLHHRLTNDTFPLYQSPLMDVGWDGEQLGYKGWYIMGVYNEENGRGFYRVCRVMSCLSSSFTGPKDSNSSLSIAPNRTTGCVTWALLPGGGWHPDCW